MVLCFVVGLVGLLFCFGLFDCWDLGLWVVVIWLVGLVVFVIDGLLFVVV